MPNETKVTETRCRQSDCEIHIEMQRRLSEHATTRRRLSVICGSAIPRAQKRREPNFSASDEEKKPQPDKQFAELLREGPPLGIHLINSQATHRLRRAAR
jgi:hypothetical protein